MITAAFGYIGAFLMSNFLSYLSDSSYLVFGFEKVNIYIYRSKF